MTFAQHLAEALPWFIEQNGIALMIAAPAVAFLILIPPSNWRN